MEQKAFELIIEKIAGPLSEQGFTRQGGFISEEKGTSVLFTGENAAYSVFYDTAKKRFDLRTCSMTDDGPDNKWKSLSTWMFDPETDPVSEAETIANDFMDTIEGTKRIAVVQQERKKKKKEEDSTSDPVFFFNRMVGVFPELKAEMNQERIVYGKIRPVTFAREHLIPKMEALAIGYPNSDTFDKMCDLLNDMYQVGDMDVRSMITMVILNGIDDLDALRSMEEKFSDDLRKSYQCAKKYKGKKVRPEKKKKKKERAYVAQTLNDLKR